MEEVIERARPLGWTTIEESKMLVEAGLDIYTADMYYYYKDNVPQITTNFDHLKELLNQRYYIPCWSLGALIDLFPTAKESLTSKCVNIQRRMKSKYYPSAWHLYFLGPDDKALHFVDASTLIEGSVEMMLLCLEHGIVKKMEVNK